MDTPEQVGIAAVLIARLGLGQRDRFLLGTALICEAADNCIQNAAENPEAHNPFVGVPIDHAEPFETAANCLRAYDVWNEKQIAGMVAEESAAIQKEFDKVTEDAVSSATDAGEG